MSGAGGDVPYSTSSSLNIVQDSCLFVTLGQYGSASRSSIWNRSSYPSDLLGGRRSFRRASIDTPHVSHSPCFHRVWAVNMVLPTTISNAISSIEPCPHKSESAKQVARSPIDILLDRTQLTQYDDHSVDFDATTRVPTFCSIWDRSAWSRDRHVACVCAVLLCDFA